MAEPNIAVLIDFENVGIDNIQSLFDELSDVGRVIVKRAYANWATQTSNSRKQSQLMEMSIQPVHQFHSHKSGKNSERYHVQLCIIPNRDNTGTDEYTCN